MNNGKYKAIIKILKNDDIRRDAKEYLRNIILARNLSLVILLIIISIEAAKWISTESNFSLVIAIALIIPFVTIYLKYK